MVRLNSKADVWMYIREEYPHETYSEIVCVFTEKINFNYIVIFITDRSSSMLISKFCL
jgi:hypothetical protein